MMDARASAEADRTRRALDAMQKKTVKMLTDMVEETELNRADQKRVAALAALILYMIFLVFLFICVFLPNYNNHAYRQTYSIGAQFYGSDLCAFLERARARRRQADAARADAFLALSRARALSLRACQIRTRRATSSSTTSARPSSSSRS